MNWTLCFSDCLTITCCYCSYLLCCYFKNTEKYISSKRSFFWRYTPLIILEKATVDRGGVASILNNKMDSAFLPTPLLSHVAIVPMPACTYLVIFTKHGKVHQQQKIFSWRFTPLLLLENAPSGKGAVATILKNNEFVGDFTFSSLVKLIHPLGKIDTPSPKSNN